MPIVHATAPPEAAELLRKHLADVLKGPGAHRHGTKTLKLQDVQISDPHRGFHFRLDDLLEKKDLSSAKQVVWRYFIFDKRDIIGIAQIAIRNQRLRWAGLTSGPSVAAKIRKLRDAEQEIEKQDATTPVELEFRGLHIPAVRFAAIWLHAKRDGGTRDLIIPLTDHPSGLKHAQLYAWPRVREALQDLAKEAHVFHQAAMQLPPR